MIGTNCDLLVGCQMQINFSFISFQVRHYDFSKVTLHVKIKQRAVFSLFIFSLLKTQ